MKLDQDIYFKIVEKASEKETFKLPDLKEDLELTDDQYEILKRNAGTIFIELSHLGLGNRYADTRKYAISMESKFKLLELEELIEAKKSSKTAFRLAFFAIMISIVALGLNIYAESQVSEVVIVNPEVKELDLIDKTYYDVNENGLEFQETIIALEPPSNNGS